MQVVMSTEIVTLTVKKNLNTLEQQWHAFAYGSQFRETVNQSYDYLKQHQLKYLLADTTHAKPLTDTDRDYYVNSIKKMHKAGLKQFIAIKPEYPFTHYTLLCVQRQLEKTLPVRIFESREAAIITLQNMQLVSK